MNSPLLQDIVTTQAERWPDAPAVAWRRNALRYRDLEVRSNQLARALREAGCRRGDRVCVLAPRTPEAVIAILAILKADAVVVNLDLDTSSERLSEIVRLCEPRCVLTFGSGAARLDELFDCYKGHAPMAVGSLGASPIVGGHFSSSFCSTDVAQLPSRTLAYRNRTANPAQIVFGTGTRGTPRGVVLTHASIRRLILWANEYFGVMPGDRHAWHSSVADGMSTNSTIGTLAAGACLHPVPSDLGCHPARLAQFVREAGLTLWTTTPETLAEAARLDIVHSDAFPDLRHIVWQGDALPGAALRQWMTQLRQVRFTRLYGATEATMVSACHRVSGPVTDSTLVPIGRPRPGEEILVLDEHLQPAPQNQVGELHIRGLGLSPGYWRDPQATGEEFLKNPAATDRPDRLFRTGDLGRIDVDGHIYLTSRRDRRVRHDFEFGEIESALKRLGSVRTAAVVAVRTDGSEQPEFGCAYVPISGVEVTPAALRADLAAALPSYMLPSRWKALDELPRDPDGSIDYGEIRRGFAGALPA